jgi:hypothetical protein
MKKFRSFTEIVSAKNPYTSTKEGQNFKRSIVSNIDDSNTDIVYDGGHGNYKRYGNLNSNLISKNKDSISNWKLFVTGKAHFYSGSNDLVSIIGKPQEICSYSFLLIYDRTLERNWTPKEVYNIWRYMNSKIFRYLLMLTTKGGQDVYKNKYKYIPILDWNSEIFNSEDLDKELYKLFNLDWYSTLRSSPSLTKYIWDESIQEPVLTTELVADPTSEDDSDEEPSKD